MIVTASDLAPTTRFGRLERRGVLLGLSGVQLAVVGVAAVVALAAVYSTGVPGLMAASPLWGLLLLVGTGRVGGRAVVEWVPIVAWWRGRSWAAATSQVASTRRGPRTSALRLPGLPGTLALLDGPGGAALVLDARAGTVTGVLAVRGSGFVLDDPAAQAHKVAAWGRVLAGVCQQPAVVRVQILVRTRPGGMGRARRWWREQCVAPRGDLAGRLARMLDEGFVRPFVRETFLSVAVRAPRGARRMTAGDVGLVGKHLDAVAAALRDADVTVGSWLDGSGIRAALTTAYGTAADDTAVPSLPGDGVRERWASVTTGTVAHATYWISEWPRSEVHAGFLQPLLLGEPTARTLSLIAEPLSTTRALREIRRAKVEHAADAAQRARIGQVESETTRAELADLERREGELVAGHGDMRFTGLVTVTAGDEAQLEQRCAALEAAAAQAMCEVRRLVGQQGVAHAAACLPLARGVL